MSGRREARGEVVRILLSPFFCFTVITTFLPLLPVTPSSPLPPLPPSQSNSEYDAFWGKPFIDGSKDDDLPPIPGQYADYQMDKQPVHNESKSKSIVADEEQRQLEDLFELNDILMVQQEEFKLTKMSKYRYRTIRK